jgi:hypothetical protein
MEGIDPDPATIPFDLMIETDSQERKKPLGSPGGRVRARRSGTVGPRATSATA